MSEAQIVLKKKVLYVDFHTAIHPPVHRYERGGTLAGILYFYQISDFRMDGIPTTNFKMSQKLCGGSTLENVVIVTNMWEQLDPEVGEAREVQLMKREILFKPLLDKGARIARNMNTVTSAHNIIRFMLDNHPLPFTQSSGQDATVCHPIDNCSGGG